jgi:uncharacterized protein (TIGR00369 family)
VLNDKTSDPPPEPSRDWGEPRERTVRWHDPMVGAEAGRSMAGLDYLRSMLAGELPPPPIAATLGFSLRSVEIGEAVFAGTPDESVYNPIGVVHGGLVCTLLDSALGCAVHSTLAAGVWYTSIELKVNYLRPVTAGSGELTARGWVTKPGRRVAFADGDVRDADGTVLATATGSCLVTSG